MTDNEKLRAKILDTLDELNKLIQKESTSGQVIKMVVDETNRLAALQADASKLRDDIKLLQVEKGSIIDKAKNEADLIVKQAEVKNKEVGDRLSNTKRLERIAEENKVKAETIAATHQAALDDVIAQKEKIRAALVG